METKINELQRNVLLDIENHSLTKFHEYIKTNPRIVSNFARQRDLLIHASAHELSGEDSTCEYTSALELSVSLSDVLSEEKRHYYYDQEIIILSNIARRYCMEGRGDVALSIYYKLYDYTKFKPEMSYLYDHIKDSIKCIREKKQQDIRFLLASSF